MFLKFYSDQRWRGGNFPPLPFLNSCCWTNNRINTRQIHVQWGLKNRIRLKKCPQQAVFILSYFLDKQTINLWATNRTKKNQLVKNLNRSWAYGIKAVTRFVYIGSSSKSPISGNMGALPPSDAGRRDLPLTPEIYSVLSGRQKGGLGCPSCVVIF